SPLADGQWLASEGEAVRERRRPDIDIHAASKLRDCPPAAEPPRPLPIRREAQRPAGACRHNLHLRLAEPPRCVPPEALREPVGTVLLVAGEDYAVRRMLGEEQMLEPQAASARVRGGRPADRAARSVSHRWSSRARHRSVPLTGLSPRGRYRSARRRLSAA